uniref:Uncharacterized protein n=1 Tax=Chromera velia CCMP2878 TaxID=1169474 RepID=A0A0G4I994_9ALVE|eukprot:Cvel_12101.t1-p1 / transcript=Cvel_12101.t1 / gene=Cvel_12101 / organism=Chromera_velia_CCMP2878 / gene_product=hypothetical protein / transcript_product=hypothetical protein / location=Cvel_scaffold779:58718-64744(+) / protein_length=1678 / sequence_SO=supercontig / SO=protein_coding / is_pseudo=false
MLRERASSAVGFPELQQQNSNANLQAGEEGGDGRRASSASAVVGPQGVGGGEAGGSSEKGSYRMFNFAQMYGCFGSQIAGSCMGGMGVGGFDGRRCSSVPLPFLPRSPSPSRGGNLSFVGRGCSPPRIPWGLCGHAGALSGVPEGLCGPPAAVWERTVGSRGRPGDFSGEMGFPHAQPQPRLRRARSECETSAGPPGGDTGLKLREVDSVSSPFSPSSSASGDGLNRLSLLPGDGRDRRGGQRERRNYGKWRWRWKSGRDGKSKSGRMSEEEDEEESRNLKEGSKLVRKKPNEGVVEAIRQQPRQPFGPLPSHPAVEAIDDRPTEYGDRGRYPFPHGPLAARAQAHPQACSLTAPDQSRSVSCPGLGAHPPHPSLLQSLPAGVPVFSARTGREEHRIGDRKGKEAEAAGPPVTVNHVHLYPSASGAGGPPGVNAVDVVQANALRSLLPLFASQTDTRNLSMGCAPTPGQTRDPEQWKAALRDPYCLVPQTPTPHGGVAGGPVIFDHKPGAPTHYQATSAFPSAAILAALTRGEALPPDFLPSFPSQHGNSLFNFPPTASTATRQTTQQHGAPSSGRAGSRMEGPTQSSPSHQQRGEPRKPEPAPPRAGGHVTSLGAEIDIEETVDAGPIVPPLPSPREEKERGREKTEGPSHSSAHPTKAHTSAMPTACTTSRPNATARAAVLKDFLRAGASETEDQKPQPLPQSSAPLQAQTEGSQRFPSPKSGPARPPPPKATDPSDHHRTLPLSHPSNARLRTAEAEHASMPPQLNARGVSTEVSDVPNASSPANVGLDTTVAEQPESNQPGQTVESFSRMGSSQHNQSNQQNPVSVLRDGAVSMWQPSWAGGRPTPSVPPPPPPQGRDSRRWSDPTASSSALEEKERKREERRAATIHFTKQPTALPPPAPPFHDQQTPQKGSQSLDRNLFGLQRSAKMTPIFFSSPGGGRDSSDASGGGPGTLLVVNTLDSSSTQDHTHQQTQQPSEANTQTVMQRSSVHTHTRSHMEDDSVDSRTPTAPPPHDRDRSGGHSRTAADSSSAVTGSHFPVRPDPAVEDPGSAQKGAGGGRGGVASETPTGRGGGSAMGHGKDLKGQGDGQVKEGSPFFGLDGETAKRNPPQQQQQQQQPLVTARQSSALFQHTPNAFGKAGAAFTDSTPKMLQMNSLSNAAAGGGGPPPARRASVGSLTNAPSSLRLNKSKGGTVRWDDQSPTDGVPERTSEAPNMGGGGGAGGTRKSAGGLARSRTDGSLPSSSPINLQRERDVARHTGGHRTMPSVPPQPPVRASSSASLANPSGGAGGSRPSPASKQQQQGPSNLLSQLLHGGGSGGGQTPTKRGTGGSPTRTGGGGSSGGRLQPSGMRPPDDANGSNPPPRPSQQQTNRSSSSSSSNHLTNAWMPEPAVHAGNPHMHSSSTVAGGGGALTSPSAVSSRSAAAVRLMRERDSLRESGLIQEGSIHSAGRDTDREGRNGSLEEKLPSKRVRPHSEGPALFPRGGGTTPAPVISPEAEEAPGISVRFPPPPTLCGFRGAHTRGTPLAPLPEEDDLVNCRGGDLDGGPSNSSSAPSLLGGAVPAAPCLSSSHPQTQPDISVFVMENSVKCRQLIEGLSSLGLVFRTLSVFSKEGRSQLGRLVRNKSVSEVRVPVVVVGRETYANFEIDCFLEGVCRPLAATRQGKEMMPVHPVR